VIRYASEIVTLRPGDLVLTGTPGGVGYGMDPPVYLRPGQVVRTSIEGIGELVNPCAPD
jgi:acylpyruvate hydrolase